MLEKKGTGSLGSFLIPADTSATQRDSLSEVWEANTPED